MMLILPRYSREKQYEADPNGIDPNGISGLGEAMVEAIGRKAK